MVLGVPRARVESKHISGGKELLCLSEDFFLFWMIGSQYQILKN